MPTAPGSRVIDDCAAQRSAAEMSSSVRTTNVPRATYLADIERVKPRPTVELLLGTGSE